MRLYFLPINYYLYIYNYKSSEMDLLLSSQHNEILSDYDLVLEIKHGDKNAFQKLFMNIY